MSGAGERPGPASEVVARFEVRRERFLDADGHALAPLPEWCEDGRALIPLYEAMVLSRAFDEKAVALQRTGRMGTYASALGQEAVTTGLAAAMRDDDVLVPSFREQGAQLWRGVTMEELLAYWGGDERGSDFAGPRGDFPVSIPVASQIPHAAGVALGLQLAGGGRAALGVCGDGATSKGDFHEALNVAGVWRLPLVVVVNNNGWAISVPLAEQTAAATLAQKAIAAGVDGVQVDGNDVVAVRDVVARALERARAGAGPCLVEALSYRLSDHTTADDASRYRDDTEVSAHWHGEPIARLRAFLTARDLWGREREEHLLGECAERVTRATDAYLAREPEPPAAMFDHLFERLPRALALQRAALAGETDDG